MEALRRLSGLEQFRSTQARPVVPSECPRLKNVLSVLPGQELDARFCRLGRDPIQLGQATSCSSPATSDDHRLTFFLSSGLWCFGCFNLRRDGQCYSNVGPVLWTSTALSGGGHPCLKLNYKASRNPISSTPDFLSGTLHCFHRALSDRPSESPPRPSTSRLPIASIFTPRPFSRATSILLARQTAHQSSAIPP